MLKLSIPPKLRGVMCVFAGFIIQMVVGKKKLRKEAHIFFIITRDCRPKTAS